MSASREGPGAALAAGAVLLLSFVDGGFFPSTWPPAIAFFLTAAALAAVLRRRLEVTRAQALCMAAMAGLAAWTVLSVLWSSDPGSSWLEAQRTFVYVATIAATVTVAGSLLGGTLAGVALVCAYSLGQRLLQGPPSPPDPFEGALLQEPLGYANALGGLAAIGLASAVVLLLRGRTRMVSAGLVALFLVTLALTGSRGGWIAALVGGTLALALACDRTRIARMVAVAAGMLLAVALVVSRGSLADDLAERGGDRPWYWHVAWQEVTDSPLVGRGAGTFELSWLEHQPIDRAVVDAHSLYLETLAELGLVGLGLLGLALAPPLVIALRHAHAPAAAGGYIAFLFHTGIDWDWEMPAVTVTGLLCGGAILVAAHGAPRSDGLGRHPSERREAPIS